MAKIQVKQNVCEQDVASLVWAFARMESRDERLFDILAQYACSALQAEGTGGEAKMLQPAVDAASLFVHSI